MKTKTGFMVMLVLAFILPVVLMVVACQSGAVLSRPEGPCDIYTDAGYPCVTAHSTTRALSASYDGPLYQVMRQSDGETLDIGIVQPGPGDGGGYADAAAQDEFCDGSVCVISVIYDQSGNGNHLYQAPPGTFIGPAKGGFNTLPIADMAPITISGHKVYGVFIMPGAGLRNNNATGLAINDEPQGIYMVFDGTHYDSGCCFNYGNTSANSRAVGRGTMDTVYFGTATAWGRGSGTGPWIMSDMEAGLFSGYNAGLNEESPTIDSWRFVTGSVNGGGGNQWEIRGGDAQEGGLTTFYQGVRPGSNENSNYYPMHRKGSVQLGNGGDNGNGSAGTFYEGVMTTGYPPEAVTDAVQANIVAARYDVELVNLSRLTTFTPESTQEVTVTFTNTTGAPAQDVALSVSVPAGWTSEASVSESIDGLIAPGETVTATFTITSPATKSTGTVDGKAEWKNQATGRKQSEIITQRIRSAHPVKINEVQFTANGNTTYQFIELFNAGSDAVDLSDWSLVNTRSQWASITAATIPGGTMLAGGDYYLFGLAPSGLAAPAESGDTVINVLSTDGFETGQAIDIEGESRTIASVGTAATAATNIFVPVSTGPWVTIPVGSTNIPVIDASGFEVGQKMGIDVGDNYEVVTVTEVGKASTLTNLSTPAHTGDTNIKVNATENILVGDTLIIGTGGRREQVVVTAVGTTGENGTGIDLASPLKFDQILAVDVSDRGTGISFTPATRYTHMSGETVQALGSGITLSEPLAENHDYGAAVINPQVTTAGYQGSIAPDQWFGGPLSASAGSIALWDASGEVLIDAMVYGAQQGNSSADGYVTTPEIAVLEGVQDQGGCIVVVPRVGGRRGFGGFGAAPTSTPDQSLGRFPDGLDTDSNCTDFRMHTATTLAAVSTVGQNTIKVASVTGLSAGQTILIGSDDDRESAVITTVGTPGATTVSESSDAGATVLTVASATGFSAGQTITIGTGANRESAIVASVTMGRPGFGGRPGVPSSITVTESLARAHQAGAQLSGSGITLASALTMAHDIGTQVAGSVPTPGAPNQY